MGLQARAAGFETYASFCYVLLAIVFGLSCALAFISHVLDVTKASEHYGEDASTRNLNNMSTDSTSRSTEQLAFEADEKYAMKQMLGEGSVYGFFLTNSRVAWVIALVTIALQILMLVPFIEGAEFDLSQTVDLQYRWKCNPSDEICEDTDSVTPMGWVIFGVLMVIYLTKDFISGLKMVILSGKRRHKHSLRARYFFGGVILLCITSYILYASAIYIKATATSDTELVIDAVVILFIMEADNELFTGIDTNCSGWIDKITKRTEEDKEKKEEAEEEQEQKEEEEEEKEEEEEGKVPEDQDMDGSSPVALRIK